MQFCRLRVPYYLRRQFIHDARDAEDALLLQNGDHPALIAAWYDVIVQRCLARVAGPSAWDVAQHMKWSRPWDDIAGFMRRAAVGEAVSHLRVLEIDGVVQVEDGEPALWSLTDRATI